MGPRMRPPGGRIHDIHGIHGGPGRLARGGSEPDPIGTAGRYNPAMDHKVLDRISLELAREIVRGLPDHPEWIDLARENLDRWSRRNADAPGLLRSYDEWRQILERPLEEVIATLLREDDEGQRLRQNSPFAGALSPQTVWGIKRRIRDESRAA